MDSFDTSRSDAGYKVFRELKKSIGHVTQKGLTKQLRQME